MSNRPIITLADDGRDNLSLWERCRLIVERGVKKYGDSGGLPISGTGRPRKLKKVDHSPKPDRLKDALPKRSQHNTRHAHNSRNSRGRSHG